MPLTPAEIDRIREIEEAREEVRRELQPPAAPKSRLLAVVSHQATLLVLGFVLTTIVGTWLTSVWKEQERGNEARAAAAKAVREAKTALVHDLSRAVGATSAACNDVLSLEFYELRRPAEVGAVRESYWIDSVRWRTERNVVGARLKSSFKDPAVHHRFADVVKERTELGNTAIRLLTSSVEAPRREAVARGGLESVNRLEGYLFDCVQLMQAEMDKDAREAAAEASSRAFWSRLGFVF